MTWWRAIVGRLRPDRGFRREFDAHMAERADDLVERGWSRDEALRTAAREFGNVALIVEDSRAVWMIPWLVSVGQDVRYLVRTIRRQPVYSVTVVLLLTFGIGLVTALFTVFDARVLRPWPVSDPSSIVIVQPRPPADSPYGTLSNIEYRYFREHAQSFVQLASNLPGGGPVGRADGTILANVQSQYVTANYFDALRIGMAAGRFFLPEEENYRAPQAVVVISERLWREYFGSDPALIGRPIRVGDQPRVVVGVAQRGFADVRNGTRVDLWLPLPTLATAFTLTNWSAQDELRRFDDPAQTGGAVFGRLKPGVTPEQATAELNLLSRQFRRAYGMDAPGVLLADTRPFSTNQERAGAVWQAYSLMFAALFLVMLLTCANVGNLVLTKTLARRGEIATRLSLGASRARVARQLVTETLVLALLSGGLALGLAATVPAWLVRVLGSQVAETDSLRPDAAVFAFGLLMSGVACVFATAGPVLRTMHSAAIGQGSNLRGAPTRRLRLALLATQIALSTVLLVGAGLLTRAISHAMNLDPGFAINEVDELAVEVPKTAPADSLDRVRDILDLTQLDVAFSTLKPITSARMEIGVRRPDQPAERQRRFVLRPVSRRYFDVLRIPVTAGRTFAARAGDHDLVVSRSAAETLWPNEPAVGKVLVRGSHDGREETYEVVGVVRDVATTRLSQLEPVIYQPIERGPLVLMRHDSPAAVDRAKALIQSAAPGVAVTARPLVEDARESITDLILGTGVAWALGIVALLLATVGAFGVFASHVEERRREIGVRMALGAAGWQVVRLVAAGASRPVIAGLTFGVVLSLILTPLLRTTLYGMTPFDPIAYVGVLLVLLTSAAIATWIPAVRATRVEPATTLRGE